MVGFLSLWHGHGWGVTSLSFLLLFLCLVQNAETTTTTTTNTAKSTTTRTAHLALLDQLFPLQSIHDAWERYPLLSKPRVEANPAKDLPDLTSSLRTTQTCSNPTTTTTTTTTTEASSFTIPTVYIPPPSSSSLDETTSTTDCQAPLTPTERLALAASLVDVDTVIPSIVPRFAKSGNTWRLVQRVGDDDIRDHPQDMRRLRTWEDASDILYEQGYTLILQSLHNVHSPIARFTRLLYEETACNYATCNLYLTPPRAQAGFAAHQDWMDVVVVQISGRKRWRVAREPTVYLTYLDQDDLYGDITKEMQQEQIVWYQDFFMEPGDVLYIPRGFVHNATSVDVEEGVEVDNDVDNEPSLHLTFGIEHEWYTTMEGVLQHGVELFRQQGGDLMQELQVTFEQEHCVAVEPGEGAAELLHLALAAMTRQDCNVCRRLRHSMPRTPAWQQIFAQRTYQEQKLSEDNNDNNNDNTNNDEPWSFDVAITHEFQTIVKYMVNHISLKDIVVFLESNQEAHQDTPFGYVTMPEELEFEDMACYLDADIDATKFDEVVQQFASFVTENIKAIIDQFETYQQASEADLKADDDKALRRYWKHTASCNENFPLALRYANNSIDCKGGSNEHDKVEEE